ncbi:hypothetical protein VCHENC02_2077C, partial [Vibrio harveyi]
ISIHRSEPLSIRG